MTLTHTLLLEQVHYDPETGHFTRRIQRGRYAAGSRMGKLHWRGYWEVKIGSLHYAASRLAFFYMTGDWPKPGLDIDHINGIRNDDRWSNLREATRSQNAANQRMQSRKAHSTPFKGVTKNGSKYEASIKVNGDQLYLGLYATPEAAHSAYVAAAKKYFGQYARER